jgi:hypothetical protein
VAARLADVRQVPPATLGALTTSNYQRLFGTADRRQSG